MRVSGASFWVCVAGLPIAIVADACGGGGPPGSLDIDGGSHSGVSSGDSSDGASSSGASSGGSSGSSSSGGGTPGGPEGYVELEQCWGSAPFCPSPEFQVTAGFYSSSGGNPTNCTTTAAGQCSYTACSGPFTSPPSDNAGTLLVSGGGIPSDASVTYAAGSYQYDAPGLLLTPGASFSVKATGDAVAAFSLNIIAPPVLTIATPPDNGNGVTISTANDLPVSWNGGTPGNTMLFEAGGAANANGYFTCYWDAALGHATVPASMLKPLAGQTNGFMTYGQFASSTQSAGAYSIDVLAFPNWSGPAVFQ